MTTSYEQQQIDLIAENKALKAQNYELRTIAIMLFNGGWDDAHSELISAKAKETFNKTPEQCLNSVKKEAIEVFARDCSESSLKLSMAAMEYCDNLLRGNQ